MEEANQNTAENNNMQIPDTNTPPAKKTPMQMIASLFSRKPSQEGTPASSQSDYNQGTPEAQTTLPTEVNSKMKKLPIPKIPKKFLFIGAGVLVLIIIILIISSILSGRNGAITKTTPSTSTPTPTSQSEVPSQYADDEDVARIKEQIDELNEDLNNANFRIDELRIPNLEWNVSFD